MLAIRNRLIGRETKTLDSTAAKILDLGKKAAIMQRLIAGGGVDRTRLGIVDFYTQGFFSLFVSGYHVEGLENLHKAQRWSAEEGKGIIFTPRHEADFDHPAARYILDHEGLRDFRTNIVWIAGVNMLKRKKFQPFMRAGHAIYIATPDDLSQAKELLMPRELNVEQQEVVKGILSTFTDTNSKAASKIKEVTKNGKNLVVYPEAGRSYDGLMKQSPREVSVYFSRHGESLVVPYRLYGPREINPPNRSVRWEKLIPGLRQHLGMRIGVPYLSSEVWEVWKVVRTEDPNANPMDWVMANIANVDPAEIRSGELTHYRNLMQRFKPERISEALALAA